MKYEQNDVKVHYELNTSTLDVLVRILLDFEKKEYTDESARLSEEAA